ncbi:MAG: hypothetical protein ACE5JO_07130 [Candidatus Binatia bacterium]
MVRIQGVRVRFSSGLESLNAFARNHFQDCEQQTNTRATAPPPDRQDWQAEIEAHLEWIEGAPPKAEYAEVSSGKTRLDRDIEIGYNEMAWSRIDDFSDLRLRFSLEENRLRLQGRHFFSLSRSPLRDQIKKAWYWRRLPALREKRFSTLLYYMVYYPAFWWLERQGLFPLHAAAVDLAGVGVVFCGLPGCGKSTLSLALLSLPEARLLSDNIIFFDRKKVFSCPEPVLVDDRSLELIGKARSLLYPLGRRHVFGRAWCQVVPDRLSDHTVPRLFFFVGLGKHSSLRPLSHKEAYKRSSAANWIAQEMRRYVVYRSVLGLLSADGFHLANREESVVRALFGQGQCYELTVGSGAGLQKVPDQVCTLLASVRS